MANKGAWQQSKTKKEKKNKKKMIAPSTGIAKSASVFNTLANS